MFGKLAVITDIHGNAPALRAVLTDISLQGEIDHICCLGDMISIGPDTNEVLELLCAQTNISMVTGNHEQYVLALVTGRDPGLHGEELAHQQWIADRLDPKLVPLLSGLPLTRRLTCAGKTILLQHYHLRADDGFASVDRQPALEKLEELYDGSMADVVCFGHHHVVHLFQSERRLYLNPGALGCCEQPVARYGILDLAGPQVKAELCEVPYDNSAFLASYERLGVPGREFILAAFHGNQHTRSR